MTATTREVPDALRRAQDELDRRFDEVAREYAGHPGPEVLAVLEREVCAAGVTPARPDLSALARQISEAPTAG